MALTYADVVLWDRLKKLQAIPENPFLLEIGQANWWGDIDPPPGCADPNPFAVAEKFYRRVLGFRERLSIDLQGHGPNNVAADLNQPLTLPQAADIVVNTGTLEHVFDQRRAFENIHTLCRPGGLMIHAVPTRNWPEHGFYTYSECLLADLADANGYEVLVSLTATFVSTMASPKVFVDYQETGWPMMRYLAWRKPADARPFRVPMQRRIGLHLDG